jgi:thiosulfate dehydrogenase (quinone) large subunit
LIFGVATRLAAVGGLLLLAPIWVMLWHTGGYLWEYPAEDLVPLLLLAIVPAGRVLGFDRQLAARYHSRWPF